MFDETKVKAALEALELLQKALNSDNPQLILEQVTSTLSALQENNHD